MIEVWLTHATTLVSGAQHKDSTNLYISAELSSRVATIIVPLVMVPVLCSMP